MAKVPEFLDDLYIISKLGNNPGPDDGLEPDPLKSKFDEAGNKIKDFINKYIIPALNNYVAGTDGLLDLTGGTMKGDINLDGKHRITRMADPLSAQDGATKSYADAKYKKLDEGKASLSGASMTGPLSVQAPTSPNHAASKEYVDKKIADNTNWITTRVQLSAASWVENKQAVSVAGVQPGTNGRAAPSGISASNVENAADAIIYIAEQKAGQVVFGCVNKPDADISMDIQFKEEPA